MPLSGAVQTVRVRDLMFSELIWCWRSKSYNVQDGDSANKGMSHSEASLGVPSVVLLFQKFDFLTCTEYLSIGAAAHRRLKTNDGEMT